MEFPIEQFFEKLSSDIDVELAFLHCKETGNWSGLKEVVEMILLADELELNDFFIEELVDRLKEHFMELYDGRNRKSA
ncbi:MAG: hypothetical protein DSY42_09380 [Aquifex sp.]|nr:MAG: hypothetical protein DSY42_09380 [Aquifex sp.]